MPEQRKRMTYEEQRAKREAERGIRNTAPEQVAKKPIVPIIIIAVLVVFLALGLRLCSQAMTINVTVNGVPCTLHGAKTVQTAIKESGLPINPGDLISIRGTILKKYEGDAVSAVVNGKETSDVNMQLHDNDVITVADGKDIVEEYDVDTETTEYGVRVGGVGALHQITPGTLGKLEVRTGKISGEVVRRETQEASDAVCVKSNPEVGEDKVIALTFENGPSEKYTGEILDILKENDAHATFFCVGSEIDKYNDALVQREYDEGHQVGVGVLINDNLVTATMTEDGLKDLGDQMSHSIEALTAALDGPNYSKVTRLPGGKITEDTVAVIDEYVDVSVGWNSDTGDWMESEADEIYHVLMSLEPGDIVRLHDGGGDMSGTVEALRKAVPTLKSHGYSFVTIDKLLEYPSQG